jgi:hypothetical protein
MKKAKRLKDHVLDEGYFYDAVANIEDAVMELDSALEDLLKRVRPRSERYIDIITVQSDLQHARYYLREVKKRTLIDEALE